MGRNPFTFVDEESRRRFEFIPVDVWKPRPFVNQEPIYEQDTILMNTKGYIIAPISYLFNRFYMLYAYYSFELLFSQ